MISNETESILEDTFNTNETRSVNNHFKIAFRYFPKQLFFNCLKLVDKCAHKKVMLIDLNNRFTENKKGKHRQK